MNKPNLSTSMSEDTASDLIIGLWEMTEAVKKLEQVLGDISNKPSFLNED